VSGRVRRPVRHPVELAGVCAQAAIGDQPVEQRDEENRQEGCRQHAAGHAGADGVARAGSRTGRDRQRHNTQDECQRGHQDRAEAQAGRLHGSRAGGITLGFFQQRILDNQNGVYRRQPQQRDQADLEIHVVTESAQPHRRERAERAEGQACIESLLTNVSSDTELQAALLNIVDGYYGEFLKEPVMRDIWRATQADKALQELDAADCEAHATLLHNTLKKLRPDNNRTALRTLSSLIMQQVAAAVRHAISLNRTQGDATIEMFKRMLATSLSDALENSGKKETGPRKGAVRTRSRK